jgi:hypothetical protein
MPAPVVGALGVMDFVSYVLWIEQYIAVNEEANRKFAESQSPAV